MDYGAHKQDVATVLYVEDEDVIRQNFKESFEDHKFSVVDKTNLNGVLSFIDQSSNGIDIAVLDMQLGQDRLAGLRLCTMLRNRFPAIPILILTLHTDPQIEEIAYRNGADAFVSKAESLSLIVTRMRSMLARFDALASSTTSDHQRAITDDLQLDDWLEEAIWKGEPLELNPTRYAILKTLVASNGETLSVYDIMRKLSLVVEGNTIVQHVKVIRNAFIKFDPSFNNIVTVRGKGYKWNPLKKA